MGGSSPPTINNELLKNFFCPYKIWFEPICFQVLWQFGVCAAEPLIFAPPHLSRGRRGEGMQFELFVKYTARKEIANASCPPRFARRLICMGFLAKKKRIYQ